MSAFTHRLTFLGLAILQPLWLTVGRLFLGSFGWLSFMLIMFGAPILLGPLMITVMMLSTRSVRETHHFSAKHARLHWLMHAQRSSSQASFLSTLPTRMIPMSLSRAST